MRTFELATAETLLINEFSKQNNLDLTNKKHQQRIADCILQTSHFFINSPLGKTPWETLETQIAYVYYFSPLNSVRMHRVLSEQNHFLQELKIKSIADFGAGLGSGGRTLQSFFSNASLHLVDRSQIPFQILQKCLGWRGETCSSIDDIPHRDTLVCSFSLTEVADLPEWIFEFENLFLMEPATQTDGRRLMAWRQKLIDAGYFAWAPCLHQEACPLLQESKTDWCHDRAHLSAPEWFLEIENLLPIKNKTLTASYLVLSKQKPPAVAKNTVRLTGDLLKEKGKDRQLICRGPQREFLSWMHKHGSHPELYRGDLYLLPEQVVQVSNELRISQKKT